MSETQPRSTAREYLEALLIAALFLGFTNTFVVKTFFIPSGSMENTLLVGDHLFVNRFIYGPASDLERRVFPLRAPRRGDIVIFRSPEKPTVDLVKRLVGLPGDTIQVVNKQLYINGQRVDDSHYAIHSDPRIFPRNPFIPEYQRLRDNFGPFTVPAESYFCMGDNRDNSNDSRFWGTVPAAFLKGRASVIYWSYGGHTSDGNWHGLLDKLEDLGNTLLGFIPDTRWRRTLHMPR